MRRGRARPAPVADPAAAARARWTLGLVTLSTVLIVVDLTIVTVALPRIQEDLGGTLAGLQWVIVGYSLTYGALLQTAGSLADRLGRRAMFAGGIAVFTLASLACGLSWSVLSLDVFRAVQGVGGALIFANALPLIAQEFAGQRRNMAIAVWGALMGSCAALAPLLGGVLVEGLGWRWVFLVNLPIGLAALVLVPLRLAETRTRSSAGIDWTGAALLVAALVLANLALTRGEAQGWTSVATLGQAAGGVVLLGAFVAVERRAAAPMLDLALFRVPSFTGAAVLSFLGRFGTFGTSIFLVLYLQGSLGLSPLGTGVALLPMFLAGLPFGILAGALQKRLPTGTIIAAGFVVAAAGAALLAGAIEPGVSAWTLAPGFAVWGAGGTMATTPLLSVAVGVVPPERSGMASGMTNSFFPIGSAAGAAVLGVVFARGVADSLAASAAVPAASRDTVAGAVAAGELDRAAGLVPPEALPAVTLAAREAVAGAASSVMAWSAALLLVAAAVALALIRQRDLVHTGEPAPAAGEPAGPPPPGEPGPGVPADRRPAPGTAGGPGSPSGAPDADLPGRV